MFLLHLATCFNLLAAICRQADRDVMLGAQSQRVGGGGAQHARPSVRVYLYTPPLEAASGVKHGLAAAQERLIQRAIDWLIGSLIGFGCLSSLGGGGGGGVCRAAGLKER